MGVSERVARGGRVVQSTQGGRGLQTTCSSARLPANQWPRRPLGVKLDRVEGMPAPATSQVQRADMRPEPGSVLGVGDTGRGWRGPGRHGNRYRQGASGAGHVTERTPSRLWGPGRPRLSLEERVGVCSPNTWEAWRAEGEARRPGGPEARRQETAQRGRTLQVREASGRFSGPSGCRPACLPQVSQGWGSAISSAPQEKSGREILTQPPPSQTGDDISTAGVPAYGSRCHVREHK